MQAFPVFAMKYATAINSTLVIPKRLFIIQKFSEEVTDYVFFENAHSHTVGTIGVLEAETKTGRKKFIFMLCSLFQVTEMPKIIPLTNHKQVLYSLIV